MSAADENEVEVYRSDLDVISEFLRRIGQAHDDQSALAFAVRRTASGCRKAAPDLPAEPGVTIN